MGHYCNEHGTTFFKRGKMKGYAHPIGETGQWCNEPEEGGDEIPESVVAENNADGNDKKKSLALSYAKDVGCAALTTAQVSKVEIRTFVCTLADSFLDWLNK